TTKWSPASCTFHTWQSIQVSTPSSTGDPDGAGLQARFANLSAPARPNTALTSLCRWVHTLTQKHPARSISGQLRDRLPGQNSTSGGSSDSAANDWQANPTGSPPSSAVTTVTPVAKCPSALRNSVSVTTPVITTGRRR